MIIPFLSWIVGWDISMVTESYVFDVMMLEGGPLGTVQNKKVFLEEEAFSTGGGRRAVFLLALQNLRFPEPPPDHQSH